LYFYSFTINVSSIVWASSVGLVGKSVKGILYASNGGSATWDKTTTSKTGRDESGLGYSYPPLLTSDDSTATELTYTLSAPSAVTIDVEDAAGRHVKTLVNESAGTPSCCTEGTHSVVWDQKSDAGTDVPDGDYAFVISHSSGVFDTSVFARDPKFSGSPLPSMSNTPVVGINNNRYEIAGGSVVKKNTNGLTLAVVATSSLTLSAIGLDSAGHLYLQTPAGVQRWQAGRLPFHVKNLEARVRVPWPNALVKATVPIIGAATGRNFKDYVVDVTRGWQPTASSSWTTLAHSFYEVQDNFVFPLGQETVYGNLASWETGLTPGEEYPEQDIFHPAGFRVESGRWTVRLRVNNQMGDTAVSTVPVIVGRVINNATGGLIRSDDGHVRVTVPALSINTDWRFSGLV
jgi:hypothetical protein